MMAYFTDEMCAVLARPGQTLRIRNRVCENGGGKILRILYHTQTNSHPQRGTCKYMIKFIIYDL
jgi:hypothetical protein